MLSQAGIGLMRLLARVPLSWVRALGWLLGQVLYLVADARRRVVWTNLRLCFPRWSEQRRRQVAVAVFIHFAQAWLDRGWLWHAAPEVLRRRLRVSGALEALAGLQPVVLFAPHFVGLDAGWTALTAQLQRPFTTIYTHQANQAIDAWILQGRQRFGNVRLFDRAAGVKPLVSSLREGAALYLLPDMNYGLPESEFLPFYGVMAATVTSMSRLARLGRARLVPVITRLTPDGYEVELQPAWDNYPTADVTADTLRMNRTLEQFVDAMPEQYYWVHKRFKDRPRGEPSVY